MYLSFDLGGTNIKAGIIDKMGNIIIKQSLPTAENKDVDEILQQFIEISKTLLAKAKLNQQEIQGVGVGLPGFIEADKGLVIKAPNLGWENIHIKQNLEGLLPYPVFLSNDANAAALGEMWKGAGQGCKDLLCLTLGTGVGGGVIIGGQIYNGRYGLAGEIGHFQVNPHEGRKCNCAKIGCLETESSASALIFYGECAVKKGEKTVLAEIMKKKKKLTGRDVTETALHGDKVALEIITNAAYYLGFALANIYTVVAPQKIIIGGGLAGAGDILFKPIIKWFNNFSFENIKGEEIIFPAKLGNDAGIVGLAKLIEQGVKNHAKNSCLD
ncbi:MAG: glcK [Clostridiales bacterium]|jgi:glucokinase|nr:glcK [Clostridiales bacterium]